MRVHVSEARLRVKVKEKLEIVGFLFIFFKSEERG
jgi:hypothetical protein